jgi:hypothetical protein
MTSDDYAVVVVITSTEFAPMADCLLPHCDDIVTIAKTSYRVYRTDGLSGGFSAIDPIDDTQLIALRPFLTMADACAWIVRQAKEEA